MRISKKNKPIITDNYVYVRKFYFAGNDVFITGIYYSNDDNSKFQKELEPLIRIINACID